MAQPQGSVHRDGTRLAFGGTIDRPTCAGLWQQVLPLLPGITVIDLSGVAGVDSAGLALLAEAASRCAGSTVTGSPPGLAALRAAYRLDEALGYSG
jgi:phospholipid transport system transporter-binding protein